MTDSEKEVFFKAIRNYGTEAQTDMAIEEMSELTKALLKYRRYGDSEASADRLKDIREEIEDVQIMLDQMMLIYGRDLSVRSQKVARLRTRLKESNK